MNRREVLEESINTLRSIRTKLEKKLIDRQEADSRINNEGKILKGIQLHLGDAIFMATKGQSVELAAVAALEHKA
jgi:hypothetical protein